MGVGICCSDCFVFLRVVSQYLKQINNQSRAVEKELERSIQNAELQRLLKIENHWCFLYLFERK